MTKLISAPGLLPKGPLCVACDLTGPTDVRRAIEHYRGEHAILLREPHGPVEGVNTVAVDGEAAARFGEFVPPEHQFIMPIPIDNPTSWWGIAGTLMEKGPDDWRHWAHDYCEEHLSRAEHPWYGGGIESFHKFVTGHMPSITLVTNALADQESVNHFGACVFGDFDYLAKQLLERSPHALQYLEGIRLDHAPPRILNVGLHTGWDLPFWVSALRQAKTPGGHIATVGPISHEHMHEYAMPFVRNLAREGECSFHLVALDSYAGTVELPVTHDGQALGAHNYSAMTEHPSQTFPCTTMDQLFDQRQFNIVKMDAEGAEQSILWGGLQSLRRERPQLAISIYHSIPELWEIPLWVMRHLPNYKLFIRCYSFTGVETIAYCIPEEVETPEGLK